MLCTVCGRSNDDTSRFCRQCGSTLPASSSTGGQTSLPKPPEPGPIRLAEGKNPVVALLFSIFLGFGQFYNGDFKRGVLFFFLYCIGLFLIPVTGGASIILVWLWGAVNAYNVAARRTPLWT